MTMISPMLCPTVIEKSSVHLHLERSWSSLEKALVQVGQERDKPTLRLLRSLYEAGIPRPILFSLSSLGVSSSDDNLEHDEHVETVATYLASSRNSRSSKLALLRVLFALRSQGALHWDDDVVRDCLDLILLRDFSWRIKEQQHGQDDLVLIWELRARTRRCMENKHSDNIDFDRIDVSRFIQSGEAAVEAISSTANMVSVGLSLSVPLIHESLDAAGSKLKSVMTPDQTPLLTPRTSQMTLACTHTAKRATDRVRETARKTLHGIRDLSTEGINRAAKRFEDEKLGERLVPDRESRELLVTAGKVGVASLGAVAIVGEAMFETTRSVAQKASSVTADVVSYKYGEEAGQVVKDVGDTTGNILRTAAHVACLERRVFTKVVAKNTAKVKERERMGIDSLKLEAFQATKKLQVANFRVRMESSNLVASKARHRKNMNPDVNVVQVVERMDAGVSLASIEPSGQKHKTDDNSTVQIEVAGVGESGSLFKPDSSQQQTPNEISAVLPFDDID